MSSGPLHHPVDQTPAARQLAEVVVLRSGRVVRLPPAFAKAAVEQLLKTYRLTGEVVEGPGEEARVGRPLKADEWVIRIANSAAGLDLMAREHRLFGGYELFYFPKYDIRLSASAALWLLRALESVKPDERDAEGRPVSWVEEQHETETLGAADSNDDDAIWVADESSLEAIVEDARPDTHPLSNTDIHSHFRSLSRFAGFDALPLSLWRGTENKLGFTTGRVWLRPDFTPLRVHLTTCPNADLAEVLASIAHELAHPLARAPGHGDAFRLSMVELAERHWGARWFTEARGRLEQGLPTLDYWMATGIRAAIRNAAPPVARTADDGQLARVVTRVRKLRELAADQLGLPEAIAATATANDFVTTHGLGNYAVRIDARIQEQMIDRWLVLPDNQVWKRSLAHAIAAANDVFALTAAKQSGMHLFGRYADLVQVEYLFGICVARIERECERHLAKWKSTRARAVAGDTKRERTSFCDSAVIAFQAKLKQIAKDEASPRPPGHAADAPSRGLEAAEAFAWAEHEKRGISWSSGGRRVTRQNDAGAEVGRSLEVVRGIEPTGGSAKQLPGR